MFLSIFIYILVVIFQICLEFYSHFFTKRIKKSYSKPLGSGRDVAKTLEKVIDILKKFEVRVKIIRNLNVPALSKNGVIFINKDAIYKTDLYSNYIVISELYLLYIPVVIRNARRHLVELFIIINFVCIIGILIGQNLGDGVVTLCAILQLLLIADSVFNYLYCQKYYSRIQDIAVPLLQLDNVEQARALRLNKDLQLKIFEYPIQLFISIWEFLKP